MPALVFGFSVGDFVAIATLLWKLGKALNNATEVSKVFCNVQVKVFAFNSLIIQLQQSVANAAALPEEQWPMLQQTLEQTEATTADFCRYIDTFKADGSNRTQTIQNWKKRVTWSLLGDTKIKSFRESMRSYSAIPTLTLQSLNKFVNHLG